MYIFSRRGFALMEALVVGAILFILLGTLASRAGTGCVPTSEVASSAERNARVHANKLGWSITGVSCSGSDSDIDGYVSCTIAFEGGPSKAVECGYTQAFAPLGQNEGCKDALPLNIQQPTYNQ